MKERGSDWVPTDREKQAARALGIDIDQWPDWLREKYRRNSLRELKAILAGHRVSVSYTWLSKELAKFDIPTSKRPAEKATA